MRSQRLYTSPRSVLLCLVPFGIFSYLLSTMPFSGLYAATAALFLYPFLLMVVLSVAGPLPAAMAGLMAALSLQLSLGAGAAVAGLVYLMLPLALYYVCLLRRIPWQHSMQALGGIFVVVVLALFMVGRSSLGDDPFATLAQSAVSSVSAMPERDYFLNTLYRFGLLNLPEEIAASPLVAAAGGGFTYSPEALQEFYKQIAARVDLWLRALLPTLACSYSIWYAVVGPFVSQHYGHKHAQRLAFQGGEQARASDYFQGLHQLPQFSNWHIPKRQAYLLWAFGALGLVTRLSGSTLAIAGQMLYLAFASFFGIQGLSLVNHMQKRQNVRPLWRGLSLVLLMAILSQAAMLIGLYDQLADPRKLRAKAPADDLTDRRTEE